MRSLVTSFVLVMVVVVGSASADDKPATKVKVYDFTADAVEGAVVKPEGSGFTATPFSKHASLIRIRRDFTAEIIKSGEDL